MAMRTPNAELVATSGTTSSASYVELESDGAQIKITTGNKALVTIGSGISNSTAGCGGRASIDLSGETERAADEINVCAADSGNASDFFKLTWTTIYNPLNPGEHVFDMRYRASGGGTASFNDRLIMAVPF
jgi:hypothetical protein